MEKRKHPRYPVQFNSYFATVNAEEGLGVVADMSAEGCLITSQAPLKAGTELRLRISLPELDLHVHIARAEVRWVRAGQFGLVFREMSDHDKGQLQLALIEFEQARNT